MKDRRRKVTKLLESADKKYYENSKVLEEAEEERRKYGTLTEKDLHNTFTI